MSGLAIEDTDGTLNMLQESVQVFARAFPGTQGLRQLRETQTVIDQRQWQEMSSAGWLGLLLPEDLGGAGLGVAEQVVLSYALGEHLITSPIATSSVLASAILAFLPKHAERSRLAEVVVSGQTLVIPVLNKVFSLEKQGEAYLISGQSDYIEAFTAATDLILRAQDNTGQDYILSMPTDAFGIENKQHRAVDGTTLSVLNLHQVIVAENQILAQGCLHTLLEQAEDFGRLALAAELAGIASQLVKMTSEYMQQREQFGQPIAKFQVIQHRLVDMWADAEFACAAIDNAVERLARQHDIDAHLAVLAAKIRANESATSVGRRAVHLYGAMGFTAECDIGLYLKRAINLAATLGSAEPLRLQFVQKERAQKAA